MTTPPLLVITRPIERSQKLLHFCQQNDFACEISPLLKIEAIADISGSLKKQIKNADILFFVSPTAVEICSQYIDLYNEDKTFAAVGKATEIALQKQKASPIFSPDEGNDSESVLKHPFWQQNTGKILIIRGENGRAFLGEELAKMGWQVDYADIYRRILQAPPAKTLSQLQDYQGKIAVPLFTVEMARLWCQSVNRLGEKGKRLLYLTVHHRIGDFLRQQGMLNVLDCSSEKQIMTVLQSQWGKL
ncbi:MAG: uroporphyrinogen-III synthase [Neisseriaceae bacterium]|nr:uroporphyrinogen-III synthase [Neisseriaceae bacterium]